MKKKHKNKNVLSTILAKNGQTSKFARKLHFLSIRKVLNLGLKAEKTIPRTGH